MKLNGLSLFGKWKNKNFESGFDEGGIHGICPGLPGMNAFYGGESGFMVGKDPFMVY
ncbi:MAG: hypothetical protein MI747_15075 [Desulfobacterales bacterium]|nr:hypothetical protein [Desulfobacterales bacterium]